MQTMLLAVVDGQPRYRNYGRRDTQAAAHAELIEIDGGRAAVVRNGRVVREAGCAKLAARKSVLDGRVGDIVAALVRGRDGKALARYVSSLARAGWTKTGLVVLMIGADPWLDAGDFEDVLALASGEDVRDVG